MSANTLNDNLLLAVREKLSTSDNMANVLMDILFIGKEAIYRRLRGEVPFTFFEVATIAKHLGISVDHVVGINPPNAVSFNLKPTRYYELRDIDYFMMEEYLEFLHHVKNDPNSEMGYASNVIPNYPCLKYEYIFRFQAYKWSYQNRMTENIPPFASVNTPEKLLQLNTDIVEACSRIKTSIYIWDERVFSSLIKDIQYFLRVKLLTQEDVAKIKEDLSKLLAELEIIARNGKFENGNNAYIYISHITLDTSYIFIESKDLVASMIAAFTMNWISSVCPNALNKVKTWVHTLRKYSTLISESGELQRVAFFNKQWEYIDML